jgi:uncharacterized membrane protein
MFDPTTEGTTSDERIWVLLAYIFSPWVSLFMYLFMKEQKTSPFLKYHSTQALVWGFSWIILSALGVGICLFPFVLIYSIYLGIQAYKGEMIEIPLITNFIRNQGWI